MSNVVSAFTAEQVERLTQLSEVQLRDWDVAGFFKPAYASQNRRSPYSRVYSFEDVVGLRILAILRKTHKVSLQHLKAVALKLSETCDQPWSSLTLYVLNGEVHFKNPEGKVQGAVSGQYAVPMPISSVVEDMRFQVEALKKRHEKSVGQIERHRYVANNETVVAGTRIPISTIRSFADEGFSELEIIQQYPSLTSEDVRAALTATDGLTQAA